MALKLDFVINTEYGKAKMFMIPDTKFGFTIEPITSKEKLYLFSGISKTITNGNVVVKDGKHNAREWDEAQIFERLNGLFIKKIKGFVGFEDQNGKEIEFNKKNLEKVLDYLWSQDVAIELDKDGNPELDEDGEEIGLKFSNWLLEKATNPENFCEGDIKN